MALPPRARASLPEQQGQKTRIGVVHRRVRSVAIADDPTIPNFARRPASYTAAWEWEWECE